MHGDQQQGRGHDRRVVRDELRQQGHVHDPDLGVQDVRQQPGAERLERRLPVGRAGLRNGSTRLGAIRLDAARLGAARLRAARLGLTCRLRGAAGAAQRLEAQPHQVQRTGDAQRVVRRPRRRQHGGQSGRSGQSPHEAARGYAERGAQRRPPPRAEGRPQHHGEVGSRRDGEQDGHRGETKERGEHRT